MVLSTTQRNKWTCRLFHFEQTIAFLSQEIRWTTIACQFILKEKGYCQKIWLNLFWKLKGNLFFFSFSYYLQCKCSEALNLTLEFLKGKSITLLQIQWNFFFKIWSLLLDVERERKKNFWNGLLKYERMVKEKEVWTCWSSFKSYFEFWVFSSKNLCFLNCRNFEKTITLFSKFDEL